MSLLEIERQIVFTFLSQLMAMQQECSLFISIACVCTMDNIHICIYIHGMHTLIHYIYIYT